MKLSILIPTIESRQKQFQKLKKELERQISENLLFKEVEIIHLLDNKEYSIGFKRNKLINTAKGKFVVFVDDDDHVCDDYVLLIYQAIINNPGIDCIGIKGMITFRKRMPRIFIHSLKYKEYFSKGKTYFRPPYHLNPIKHEIAKKYRFEDINYSEDIDWAMKILSDNVLKKEYFINKVIYYYYSRRFWFYQYLLDISEIVRHALGLRFSNRIRIKRWFNST
jgi:hypothetical protein